MEEPFEDQQPAQYNTSSGNTFQAKRKSLFESESEKLPINLCAKPNLAAMGEAKYESSVREMMDNRIFLDDEERKAFGEVVRQGVPANLRAQFWNLCTGIYMYQQGYCEQYYQTLHNSLKSGELSHYPNQMFEKYRRDISRAFPNDNFYTDEIKESIARIIEAYIWRNPTVGYI